MKNKYDSMQIAIVVIYVTLLVCMLYIPYKIRLDGSLINGYKNIFNWIICFMYIKWIRAPFGTETNKSLDNSLFLIWVTFAVSLVIKILFGNSEGQKVLWYGIGLEVFSMIMMTIFLYVEQAKYYVGRRIK